MTDILDRLTVQCQSDLHDNFSRSLFAEAAVEIERLRRDAERYRRLRDNFTWTLTCGADGTRLSVYMPGIKVSAIGPESDEFDAAVDAATEGPNT